MKVTIKGFVTYRTEGYYRDEERPHWSRYDPRLSSCNKDILVGEQSIEVEIPDNFDPRPLQVQKLREEQQKVRAAMAARIKELDDQINRLLALEMSA